MISSEELRFKLNMVLQFHYKVNPNHIKDNIFLMDLLDLDDQKIDRMVLEIRVFFMCEMSTEEIKSLTDLKSLFSALETKTRNQDRDRGI